MQEKSVNELPVGFMLSLAMNEKAMKRFVDMDESQRKAVEEESSRVKSKAEMERLVDRLAKEDL